MIEALKNLQDETFPGPYSGTGLVCGLPMRRDTAEEAEPKWQGIESAPTDGRRVLLWRKEWELPQTGQFYGEWWASDYSLRPLFQPTHWMPVPPPSIPQ